MRLALLDFPWALTDLLNDYTDASAVMLEFNELARRFGLKPAAFIDSEMQAEFWQRVSEFRGGNNRFQAMRRFLEQCSTDHLCAHSAVPEPAPDLLRETWRRALRDSMHDLADWRRPQIVVPAERLPVWATQDGEVTIRCSDEPAIPHFRSVISLSSYEDHGHAQSDFDPWDLQRCHPAAGSAHPTCPCILPRPPCLIDVDLQDLASNLGRARALGWQSIDRRWFIPPDGWKATHVDKVDWRLGHIFATADRNGRSGYRDFLGNVWAWDDDERHWDVQLEGGSGSYVRVSHTGRILP